MARKTKEEKVREDNLNAFFEALELMEKEKGISCDYLAEKIAGAIVVSAKKDYGSKDVVFCNIDCEKRIFDAANKDVRKKGGGEKGRQENSPVRFSKKSGKNRNTA